MKGPARTKYQEIQQTRIQKSVSKTQPFEDQVSKTWTDNYK